MMIQWFGNVDFVFEYGVGPQDTYPHWYCTILKDGHRKSRHVNVNSSLIGPMLFPDISNFIGSLV